MLNVETSPQKPNHEQVSDFNAWHINKTGSYDVVLEYWPQQLFYIGSAISITTLILCILYISKNKIKTTYKQYIKKNRLGGKTKAAAKQLRANRHLLL